MPYMYLMIAVSMLQCRTIRWRTSDGFHAMTLVWMLEWYVV
jgi:hypothetical protein